MRAEIARQIDVELDFLAPYFARLGDPETVTRSEASQIRENCLADFKQMMLDRVNKVQKEYEEVNTNRNNIKSNILSIATYYKQKKKKHLINSDAIFVVCSRTFSLLIDKDSRAC